MFKYGHPIKSLKDLRNTRNLTLKNPDPETWSSKVPLPPLIIQLAFHEFNSWALTCKVIILYKLYNTNATVSLIAKVLLKRTITRVVISQILFPRYSPPHTSSFQSVTLPLRDNEALIPLPATPNSPPSPSLASCVPFRSQSVPTSLLRPPDPSNPTAPTQSIPKQGILRHAPRPSLPNPTSSSRPYPQRRKPCNIPRPSPWLYAFPASKTPA